MSSCRLPTRGQSRDADQDSWNIFSLLSSEMNAGLCFPVFQVSTMLSSESAMLIQ